MDSLWLDSISNSLNLNSLNKNIETDICIIGGGIFGLTSAYFLSNLGFKVVLLEKEELVTKTTAHTTGKITSQHGLFYNYLADSYSKQFAKDYWRANEEAIDGIKEIIDKEKIKCDFMYQNNYIYTTKENELEAFQKEFDTLQDLGIPCEWTTKTGLPFDVVASICFKNQAQFNPVKYCYSLAKCILNKKAQIYTNSKVISCEKSDDSYITYTQTNNVKSKYVIMACHYPFINVPGFYFTKMYQSTSYIIAVDTKKSLFNGMYINNSSPFFSFRTAKYKGKDILLIAGGDHKTGQPSSYQDTYGILEKKAKELYPDCEIIYRWNTEDCISLDKIPYIGVYSNLMPHMYVGTGFKKWGMTSSYVASRIITDMICDKENPYSYIFNSTRLKPLKNFDEMKNMIIQSSNSLLFEKLKDGNLHFDEIQNNSGSIIDVNNEKVGIYKDENGKVFAVKPICTHLGCLLSWNDVDKTWDCPCHGSRYDYKGKNLYSPAFTDLETYDV